MISVAIKRSQASVQIAGAACLPLLPCSSSSQRRWQTLASWYEFESIASERLKGLNFVYKPMLTISYLQGCTSGIVLKFKIVRGSCVLKFMHRRPRKFDMDVSLEAKLKIVYLP